MKKRIEDYLHFYIGSDIQYPDIDGGLMIAQLTGISREDGVETTYKKKRFKKGECKGDYLSWKPNGFHKSNANNIKLILRPISSMTEEEAREFCKMEGWGEDLENIVVTDGAIDFKRVIGSRTEACISRFTRCRPEMFAWLLSKSFDLFGLLEEGLAIEKQ